MIARLRTCTIALVIAALHDNRVRLTRLCKNQIGAARAAAKRSVRLPRGDEPWAGPAPAPHASTSCRWRGVHIGPLSLAALAFTVQVVS